MLGSFDHLLDAFVITIHVDPQAAKLLLDLREVKVAIRPPSYKLNSSAEHLKDVIPALTTLDAPRHTGFFGVAIEITEKLRELRPQLLF